MLGGRSFSSSATWAGYVLAIEKVERGRGLRKGHSDRKGVSILHLPKETCDSLDGVSDYPGDFTVPSYPGSYLLW